MQIQKVKDVVVMHLTPDDLSSPQETSRVVEALLQEDGERKFVADLSHVPDLMSLQAGTLFTLHALCYENVAIMKLSGANKKVKMILRLIGLDKIIEIHHGRNVALESFGPYHGEPPTTEGTPLKRTSSR
jgi:anti-anti-sigma factor